MLILGAGCFACVRDGLGTDPVSDLTLVGRVGFVCTGLVEVRGVERGPRGGGGFDCGSGESESVKSISSTTLPAGLPRGFHEEDIGD